MIKIKFTDFGRCLVCLKNPCECKKMKTTREQAKKTHREFLESIRQYCANCNIGVADETAKWCGMCYSKLKSIYGNK